MSLRRSSNRLRHLPKIEYIESDNEENILKTKVKTSFIKKEEEIHEEIKPIKKKRKVTAAPKVKKELLGATPDNWERAYDKIKEYRKEHEAPVDTMGCATLADRTASEEVQRFQTLVALMLSSQTKDTVTSVVVQKLKTELPGGLTLESIINVDQVALDKQIYAVGFHTKKAAYIKRTAEILRDQYNGDIPDTIEGLVSLPGVGPKMGYLTLQNAWNKNLGIGVDVHVHRIANRLGWVETKTPEETRMSLESWLPKDKWKEINPILVGYGQIVCLPRGPKCEECPAVLDCPSAELKRTVKKQKMESKTTIKQESLDW
ncbi:DNA glycosylase [Backusella circina FSU 941]|nr:DNA glycosylase [Backusella circina FSU 941]